VTMKHDPFNVGIHVDFTSILHSLALLAPQAYNTIDEYFSLTTCKVTSSSCGNSSGIRINELKKMNFGIQHCEARKLVRVCSLRPLNAEDQ
jgi:hypothetical protein